VNPTVWVGSCTVGGCATSGTSTVSADRPSLGVSLNYGHEDEWRMAERIEQKSEQRGHEGWFDRDRLISRTRREYRTEFHAVEGLSRFSGLLGHHAPDSEDPSRSTYCFRHCRPRCFAWLVLRELLTTSQTVNMTQRPITELTMPYTKLKSGLVFILAAAPFRGTRLDVALRTQSTKA
jgi:hypothetical protein